MDGTIYHSLEFSIRNQTDKLVFITDEKECDRLKSVLLNFNEHEYPNRETKYFSFQTLYDGQTVAINLADVQSVAFLFDFGSIKINEDSDYRFQVGLRGREAPFITTTENAVELYDFFVNLEHGPEIVPFLKIEDYDGEYNYFNAREIVWFSAPTKLMNEGEELVIKEDECTGACIGD